MGRGSCLLKIRHMHQKGHFKNCICSKAVSIWPIFQKKLKQSGEHGSLLKGQKSIIACESQKKCS